MSVGVLEQAQRSSDSAGALALLSGLAVALSRGMDTDPLLAELAGGVQRMLDADWVSLLLLDDADRLVPTAAVTRQQDGAVWQRFRRRPPIPVGTVPGGQELLAAGRVVIIDDARQSPLVPVAWRRAVGPSRLAVAPVFVGSAPAGVLLVDRTEGRPPFTGQDATLLEGLAALAGAALGAVGAPGEPRTSEKLAHATAAIAAARTPRAVAEHVLEAALALARAEDGLVAALNDSEFEILALRGGPWSEPGRYPLTLVPQGVRARCAVAWTDQPCLPVAAMLRGRPLWLLPLGGDDRVLGVLVLAMPSPTETMRARLAALGQTGGLALRAVAAEAGRCREAAALDALAAVAPGEPAQFRAGIERTAAAFAQAAGSEFLGVVVANQALSRATGLLLAAGEPTRLLRAWQKAGPEAPPKLHGAELLVPLETDGRVLGALVLRPYPPGQQAAGERLARLASGLACAIARQTDCHRLAETERIAATAEARASVAARCYREATQVLSRLGDQLCEDARRASRTPDSSARLLVSQARALVQDAADAAALPGPRSTGPRSALVALAEAFSARTGLAVIVAASGRLPTLDPATQVAALHAVRTLLSLFHQARAGQVLVHLSATSGQLVVMLTGDASIATGEDLADAGVHAAVRHARGWLVPVDGSLEYAMAAGQPQFTLCVPTRQNTETRGPLALAGPVQLRPRHLRAPAYGSMPASAPVPASLPSPRSQGSST
ncbi:MAG: GAF domain-containing protein [Mycobacteriales bacterium]